MVFIVLQAREHLRPYLRYNRSLYLSAFQNHLATYINDILFIYLFMVVIVIQIILFF